MKNPHYEEEIFEGYTEHHNIHNWTIDQPADEEFSIDGLYKNPDMIYHSDLYPPVRIKIIVKVFERYEPDEKDH